MQKFEFSKISKSTFNVEQTSTSRPKILQLFLGSLDKNIKFSIHSDTDFQKLSNGEIVYFDDYGNLTISVPSDPKPWEIIQIVNLIDTYTVADSEIEGELKGVISVKDISDKFINLAFYLSLNLEHINEYKDIAVELTFDLYNFGTFLKKRALCDFPQNYDYQNLPTINEEEEIEFQMWLFGTEVFNDIQKKFNKKVHHSMLNKLPLTYEDVQNHKISNLNRFFKDLVNNPLHLKYIKNIKNNIGNFENDYLKTPLGSVYLQNANNSITMLNESLNKLVSNDNFYTKAFSSFTDFFGTYFLKEQEKFFSKPEVLKIKKELLESKNFTDLEIISRVELDAIRKIQNEILNFPYRRSRSITTENLSDEMISYLISLTLSYKLFCELNFSFQISDIHLRSVLVFKLSDGSYYWFDFTPPVGERYNFKITESLFCPKDDSKVINEYVVSIMRWCHTYNLSGKRLQPYTTLVQDSSKFIFSLYPADLAIKKFPLNLLNNFKY